MARAQAKQGHEVVIYTTKADNQRREFSVPTDIPVIDERVEIWHFKQRYFNPLCVSGSLVQCINKTISSYDIVHIHGLYRFPPTYAAWRAGKVGVPYIIRPHGSLDPFLYKQSRYSLLLKRIYEALFDIPNLNNASAIHYTTQEEFERTGFLGLRAKPAIVPNGIDWQIYEDLPSKGSFRRRLGLSDRTPLVLFLGRVNFKKGLDMLVPAFGHVVQEYPDARLAVVGPDNEGYASKVRRWCGEQCIEKKVLFVDHLSSEEVKKAYVDADVFVLPSYTENFGMTVVEAMACKCPVVISDQVNIWREIQAAGAGIVVNLDQSALAGAMSRILKDKSAARKMGVKGRIAAEKCYSWPRIVQQLTGVYRELINENLSSIRFKQRYS